MNRVMGFLCDIVDSFFVFCCNFYILFWKVLLMQLKAVNLIIHAEGSVKGTMLIEINLG